MANEITLSVAMSATNPASISVAHTVSGKQFSQAATKDDVFKGSFSVATSYTDLPLGFVAYANHALILVTNRAVVTPPATNYLIVSLDGGTTESQEIPVHGTTVLWPRTTLGATAIKLKFASTAAVAEITCVESNV